jgi:hypothetical protein
VAPCAAPPGDERADQAGHQGNDGLEDVVHHEHRVLAGSPTSRKTAKAVTTTAEAVAAAVVRFEGIPVSPITLVA